MTHTNACPETVHSFKRRTLATAFSQREFKGMEDRVLTHVKEFTDLLGMDDDNSISIDSEWKSTKLMTELCDWIAFDIIGDITYGKSFDMLRSPNLRWVPSVYSKMSRRGMAVCVDPLKPHVIPI